MKKLSQILNESSLSQGDTVKIKSGKHAGKAGTIDMMLKDGYIVELEGGKKVEILNAEI